MEQRTGRPAPAQGLAGKDLGDEYLFQDSTGDRVHVLNGTARAIYLLCDGTRSAEEVGRAIAERYDVSEETAIRDATDTIERLLDAGILKPTS